MTRKQARMDAAIAELAANRKEAERLRLEGARGRTKNRARILRLDKRRCAVCGFTICLEVHHIVPVASGGRNTLGNLITLCPNHHAMAHRGLISANEFARCVARRTHQGRMREACDLMEYIAREWEAAKSNPAKLARLCDVFRAELPARMTRIYGLERDALSASLDSFLQTLPSAAD